MEHCRVVVMILGARTHFGAFDVGQNRLSARGSQEHEGRERDV